MAFIAVNAKADVQGSKKGKVTPAQNAVMNAMTLYNKTGILDLGEGYRCEPTVSTPVDNEVTVTFNRGYIVICGRLVEVEQGSTVKITLPATGSVTGRIVARFNLSASGDEEFKVVATTDALIQNDLNKVTTGRYDFPLAFYTATASGANVTASSNHIPSVESVLYKMIWDAENPTTVQKAEIANKASNYNESSGTIKEKFDEFDERLTALGFKQGSITNISGATLTKMGKYAILKFPAFKLTNSPTEAVMSEGFVSKKTFDMTISQTGYNANFQFTANSRVVYITGTQGSNVEKAQIGFEIV